jgi:hypothetical protein
MRPALQRCRASVATGGANKTLRPASLEQKRRAARRLKNSPGIRSEIVPLSLGAPSRPPNVAGREATKFNVPKGELIKRLFAAPYRFDPDQ